MGAGTERERMAALDASSGVTTDWSLLILATLTFFYLVVTVSMQLMEGPTPSGSPGTGITIGFLALYVATLGLRRWLPVLLRKVVFLLGANLHAVVLCLVFEAELGASQYLFALAAVPFVVFASSELGLAIGFSFFAILNLALVELYYSLEWVVLPGYPKPVEDGAFDKLATFGTLYVLVACLVYFAVVLRRIREQLEQERAKTEGLLLNLLPERTLAQLRSTGTVEPETFEAVTVMFADAVGFTEHAARCSPEQLIGALNRLYTGFDEIARRHHCERIKTIGDAYLCVCGLPEPNPAHAERVVAAALEMAQWVRDQSEQELSGWSFRFGVDSGRVVGGVVGTRKYVYDIFGDTVNVASRMEALSEPGRITISDRTHAALGEAFPTEERGLADVRGRGSMRLYFVREPA